MADLKELTRRFIDEVWNQGKLDLVEQFVAPDCITHDPAAPGRVIRGLIHAAGAEELGPLRRWRACPAAAPSFADSFLTSGAPSAIPKPRLVFAFMPAFES